MQVSWPFKSIRFIILVFWFVGTFETVSKAADLLAEAKLEAKSLGLKDAAAMAKVWQKKAGELRQRRAEINVMVREVISKIDKAKDVEAIAVITKDFTDQMVEKTGAWGV